MRGGSRRLHRTGECAATAGMRQKRRLLVGLCPCLPTGQLDPDERTNDDAGAIQNLVVCHGGMTAHGAGAYPAQPGACGLSIGLRRRSDGWLGPQATSTSLRTDARQRGCNGRCAWDRGGRGNLASCADRSPDPQGNSRSCDAACAATPWRRRSGQNPMASRRARSRTAARPQMSSRPCERRAPGISRYRCAAAGTIGRAARCAAVSSLTSPACAVWTPILKIARPGSAVARAHSK
jgi:hypothetical protein